MKLSPIGHIKSPYKTKFGVPRQPGLAPSVRSDLVFNEGTLANIKLNVGDWIHLIWAFSHNVNLDGSWSKTVRPPILGGTKRIGVFATRSSFRPNNLALSTVRVCGIEEGSLQFIGGDMVDGTPVYDIAPYDPRVDAIENALSGWQGKQAWPILDDVVIADELLRKIPDSQLEGLRQVLIQDPRPAYTRIGQDERRFWTAFDKLLIWFEVTNNILQVTDIREIADQELEGLIKTGNMPK